MLLKITPKGRRYNQYLDKTYFFDQAEVPYQDSKLYKESNPPSNSVIDMDVLSSLEDHGPIDTDRLEETLETFSFGSLSSVRDGIRRLFEVGYIEEA